MQTAHELDPACADHAENLERLMRRVPLAVAEVLEVGLTATVKPYRGVAAGCCNRPDAFAVPEAQVMPTSNPLAFGAEGSDKKLLGSEL